MAANIAATERNTLPVLYNILATSTLYIYCYIQRNMKPYGRCKMKTIQGLPVTTPPWPQVLKLHYNIPEFSVSIIALSYLSTIVWSIYVSTYFTMVHTYSNLMEIEMHSVMVLYLAGPPLSAAGPSTVHTSTPSTCVSIATVSCAHLHLNQMDTLGRYIAIYQSKTVCSPLQRSRTAQTVSNK